MLNEKQLSQILEQPISTAAVSEIHWRCEESTPNSILFYKIADEIAEKVFYQKIKNSNFSLLVVNKKIVSEKQFVVIPEDKWPKIQAAILDVLYPLPPLKLLALTGTNGKTTTADLVLQLGEMSGKKGMSIGTLGVRYNHKTILDFGLTSPSLIDLRKYLNLYGKEKDFCVLEVSSHALVQDRIHGLTFEAVGWSSFSQDHLDFHGTLEAYFEAKMQIFRYLKEGAKVFIPREDSNLFAMVSKRNKNVSRTREIKKDLPLFLNTIFNRRNLEVALEIAEVAFGAKDYDFKKLVPPEGRFFIQKYGSSYIVVDFAHTPDALDNICRGIKDSFPQHKLKVLFGCGGDRDRLKRPLMAKAVEKHSEHIYLTSDNPRNEDPEKIINDIIKGISTTPYTKITERPLAVDTALNELGNNEVLLLAGKGHEDYILIKGTKYPYSDIQKVKEFIERKARG